MEITYLAYFCHKLLRAKTLKEGNCSYNKWPGLGCKPAIVNFLYKNSALDHLAIVPSPHPGPGK